MNNFDVSQLFNPFYVEQLISFSETFDRNSIPIEKAVALNDCVDAIDKVHRASKVLLPEYAPLMVGTMLAKWRQCQMQDQNQQGVIR